MVLQGLDVQEDGLTDVDNSLFLRCALTDAPRKAWNFHNPQPTLALVHQSLSHVLILAQVESGSIAVTIYSTSAVNSSADLK